MILSIVKSNYLEFKKKKKELKRKILNFCRRKQKKPLIACSELPGVSLNMDPARELFLWSVLMNRKEMALLFWNEGTVNRFLKL